MAAQIATVTQEGEEIVVRFPQDVPIQVGSVSYRIGARGEVVLAPVSTAARQEAWIAFLDRIEARDPDPEFMKERPMNRLPVERNLFPDD